MSDEIADQHNSVACKSRNGIKIIMIPPQRCLLPTYQEGKEVPLGEMPGSVRGGRGSRTGIPSVYG